MGIKNIVTPSNLRLQETNFNDRVENNYDLKIGVVQSVDYPAESGFPFPLYTVLIKEKQGDVLIDTPLKNCILKDSFGSFPDYLEYSLRVGTIGESDGNDTGITNQGDNLNGATVLVQLLNGSIYNGVIVGAVHVSKADENQNTVYPSWYLETKEGDAPYLKFSFNGILMNIRNDGSFRIRRTSPTKDDGNYVGVGEGEDGIDNQAGVEIEFGAAGGITLYTNVDITDDKNNGGNQLTIDKDGKINVICQTGQQIEISGKDSDAKLVLGSGDVSVAIAQEVKNLYDQLKIWLDSHQHATSMGSSSPPIGQPSPDFNQAIISSKMKLPNG